MAESFTDRFDKATVPGELASAAAAWPDREAYVFEDGRLSFADAAGEAAAMAAGLRELGIVPGNRVAVLMAGYAQWPAVYFGVMAAGAILVPINTRLTPGEISDLVVRSEAASVVYRADPERGGDLQGRVRLALASIPATRRPGLIIAAATEPGPGEAGLGELLRSGGARPVPLTSAPTAPDSVAAVIYTSGSTGKPKGVMLRHRAMLRGAYYSSSQLAMGPGDRLFSAQPFFHAGGAVQVMLAPVVLGSASVTQSYFDAPNALSIMEREHCTLTLGHQPHWVDYLARPDVRSRLSLRSAFVIGESAIRREIYDRLGLVTVSPYGMTETHLGGASATLADGVDACLNTHGRPFPGVTMVIRDPGTGEPVKPGQTGEICFGGWCPMSGYLGEPGLTAEALDPVGAVRTGDLGFVGPDGLLRLVGRRKEMIRVGGENVSPLEIADVLCAHPAVKQAVVVPLRDYRLGEVVAAAIECRDGSTVDLGEILSFCSQRLARYKVPRHIAVVTELPMTGTGKVDRAAVRAQLAGEWQDGSTSATRSSLQGSYRRSP